MLYIIERKNAHKFTYNHYLWGGETDLGIV